MLYWLASCNVLICKINPGSCIRLIIRQHNYFRAQTPLIILRSCHCGRSDRHIPMAHAADSFH